MCVLAPPSTSATIEYRVSYCSIEVIFAFKLIGWVNGSRIQAQSAINNMNKPKELALRLCSTLYPFLFTTYSPNVYPFAPLWSTVQSLPVSTRRVISQRLLWWAKQRSCLRSMLRFIVLLPLPYPISTCTRKLPQTEALFLLAHHSQRIYSSITHWRNCRQWRIVDRWM